MLFKKRSLSDMKKDISRNNRQSYRSCDTILTQTSIKFYTFLLELSKAFCSTFAASNFLRKQKTQGDVLYVHHHLYFCYPFGWRFFYSHLYAELQPGVAWSIVHHHRDELYSHLLTPSFKPLILYGNPHIAIIRLMDMLYIKIFKLWLVIVSAAIRLLSSNTRRVRTG